VTKELSHVMLKLHNVRMELLNVTRIITCDVETTQCEDGIVKREKKVRK